MRICGDAGILMACTTVALSPHYPWYFPGWRCLAVLAPSRAVLWLSIAPVLLYFDPLDNLFVWSSIVYVPAILLAVAGFRRRGSASPAIALEGNA